MHRERVDDLGGSWRPSRPFALHLLAGAVVSVTLVACDGLRPPTAEPSTPPTASAEMPSFERPASPLPAAEQAFADAWATIVEAFDREAVEVLIANPLSEYDLVGARLIDAIDGAHDALASLRPPEGLVEEVSGLILAIDAVSRRLAAIDPHGPRTEIATAYVAALDEWVEEVRPRAQAVRDALALPPVPLGDLQL